MSRVGSPNLNALLAVAAFATFIRVAWCVAGFLRMFSNHRRSKVSNWGLIQLVVVPEAYLLGLAGLLLWLPLDRGSTVTPFQLASGVLGSALSGAGLLVSVWTFFAFPSIGTGHYVAEGQLLVSRGPYAWVRHPTYLGVLLLWFGLAIAFRSLPVLLAAAFYSVVYHLYARREEEMMSTAFGDAYVRYCAQVGRFLPRSLHPFRPESATESQL
jgi:protein-S-isoprenylcysteine O-methyltransferase Ste14